MLQSGDVGFVSLLGEPSTQGLERPHIADASLLFKNRMGFGDHIEGFRSVKRCALREFDQNDRSDLRP